MSGMKKKGRPIRVTACGATGYAKSVGIKTEDEISLLV